MSAAPISILYTLPRLIDRYTGISGRLLSLLVVLMMLTLSTVVILRYGFNIGSIALQELATYLHGSIFMLGAGYALKQGAHVRVDIFYRKFSLRGKAWIDALGAIVFVLPFCIYVLLVSGDFVSQSWAIFEHSAEPGGLPAVFLLKTLIPLMAINLALQAIAELCRNLISYQPQKAAIYGRAEVA